MRKRSSPLGAATALLVFLTAVTGCAHRPINARATTHDPKSGYRISTTPATPENSDELFVVLAFSGGGTRASAFSYGALEKLAATKIRWRGQERRLLDEVDVISSVSGGSFTAAYYGLYRDKLFTDFPDRFLYRNVTSALVWRLFNPVNWFRLASPYYDRIDLAAEYYDDQVFDHKTFADLAALHTRPFIVLNATDMSFVARFEFTQDQFDLMSSDLASYPVARGVAASSAFPVLLSPLTLYNYPGATVAPWMKDALANRDASPRDFAVAQVANSYLNTERRPFVHVLDGGLADNIGLRGPAQALFSTQNTWAKPDWSLSQLLNTKIKYLVVITVNARPADAQTWDRHESGPGVLDVLSTVTGGPLGNYSFETVQYVRDTLDSWRQSIRDSQEIARLRGGPIPPLRDVKFYAAELTFEDVKDPAERDYLNQIPTDFHITHEAVDRLRKAAGELLEASPEIQKLINDLAQDQATP